MRSQVTLMWYTISQFWDCASYAFGVSNFKQFIWKPMSTPTSAYLKIRCGLANLESQMLRLVSAWNTIAGSVSLLNWSSLPLPRVLAGKPHSALAHSRFSKQKSALVLDVQTIVGGMRKLENRCLSGRRLVYPLIVPSMIYPSKNSTRGKAKL
jgi:hypothetical protein